MPIYTFKCSDCGKIDSARLPIGYIGGRPVCKKCNKEMRRYFGALPPVIFKGGGFYVTDNKNNDGTKTDD